jgi:hypothetical protein
MDKDFKVLCTSIQGKSHKKMEPQIPCQDAFKYEKITNGGFKKLLSFKKPISFSISIVSDGAGSSTNSHLASSFCVNRLLELCKSRSLAIEELTKYDFKKEEDKKLILDGWNKLSNDLFNQTRADLLLFGEESGHEPKDLYCTLILVIKTPFGFLSANIGDGRAGYSNGTETRPLIVPFMTFTAGATFFLIKEGWDKIFRSYVIFEDKVDYYFVSSDGCQEFLIDGSSKGPKTGVYDDILGDNAFYDLNRPFHPFFEGLIKSLNEVNTSEEANTRLTNLIENGIYLLNNVETELKSISDPTLDDDKTMIIHYK